ncbi:MAG TPA: hypothetical protein VMW63_05725 [Methanoregulaceae archaeon]|nr:hypothetical protein [Methanoregulaceae archaeon]
MLKIYQLDQERSKSKSWRAEFVGRMSWNGIESSVLEDLGVLELLDMNAQESLQRSDPM